MDQRFNGMAANQYPMGFIWGGNMEQVIEAIHTHGVHSPEIQLFIGYCGWDVGELEAEVNEGSWTII
jgi:putative transcriptional regulator